MDGCTDEQMVTVMEDECTEDECTNHEAADTSSVQRFCDGSGLEVGNGYIVQLARNSDPHVAISVFRRRSAPYSS